MVTLSGEESQEIAKSTISKEIILLLISTLLLRIGFGAILILFDWTLVWGIEHTLGVEAHSSVESILLTSFAAITYLIAEILMTGYYGNRSDKVGAKPVILFATIGSFIVILLYMPSTLIFDAFYLTSPIVALLLLTGYLALIHFIHGVFAAAKVAPTLGFINHYSDETNRTLHMAYFDNAILYGRALGMMSGAFTWIYFKVDHAQDVIVQSRRISLAYVPLSVLLLVASLIIYFGLNNTPTIEEPKPFNLKEDVKIAFSVMMKEERRPLLLPWLSIAALIGSASIWGPSVAFRIVGGKDGHNNDRGFEAILPIMVILFALALPAPFWGWYADRHGKKRTMTIGLFGIPIALVLGLAIGFPFYGEALLSQEASIISNIPFLASLAPAIFFFSSFIPVLIGSLGETAHREKKEDGHVMSGYHFVIAMGEIIGILGGGLFIGLFALFHQINLIPDGNLALLVGFVLFELILVAGMTLGILRLPDRYH
ncbi:MAG: MFS transporter [Methanobacteriota archaeon]|nr:MAG: MFS transporter [Euryarchaeota archaeon]